VDMTVRGFVIKLSQPVYFVGTYVHCI